METVVDPATMSTFDEKNLDSDHAQKKYEQKRQLPMLWKTSTPITSAPEQTESLNYGVFAAVRLQWILKSFKLNRLPTDIFFEIKHSVRRKHVRRNGKQVFKKNKKAPRFKNKQEFISSMRMQKDIGETKPKSSKVQLCSNCREIEPGSI